MRRLLQRAKRTSRHQPTSPSTIDLDWRTVPSDRVAEHPDLLSDLLAGRMDGVTVTGVLTPDEASRAVGAIPDSAWEEHFIGRIIGMAIGMEGEDDRSTYLADTERARSVYRMAFGFDPHERLQEVLAPASGGIPLIPAEEGGRDYNPGHLRYWEPGRSGLKAHVGNEFRRELEETSMKHLLTTTSVKDHLSYFVVLQPPDVGGELSVYDLRWEQDDASGDARVDLRDDSRFDEMPSLKLRPNAGDLILFRGGSQWHRVEPLVGKRARITYGGFCAWSIDRAAIHFWS